MSEKTFEELGIEEPILRAIDDKHFTVPTKIQAKSIPLILDNNDVIGTSKTGSGKTLAFSCGIIQNTKPEGGIQCLVLVPTRELATQVAKSFEDFSKYKDLNICSVYGGVSINPQFENLKIANIVVGTPGRILDHISRDSIDLNALNTLVLDEADMMLDMGFLPDVERIIRKTPKSRQTLLYSATMNDGVYHLTQKYLNNPKKISADEYVDRSKLKQIYYDVQSYDKFSLLTHLLKEDDSDGLVMVFCNTRENSDFVAKNLKVNGVKARVIHGGLTQNKRSKILDDFNDGKVTVLVCTDVAARGLDIGGVSHVYNYDVCKDAKQYIHRIGRTARAGSDGKAVVLLSQNDHRNFDNVLRQNDINIEREDRPRFEKATIEFKPESRRNRSGPRGKPGNRGGPRGNSRPRPPRRHTF